MLLNSLRPLLHAYLTVLGIGLWKKWHHHILNEAKCLKTQEKSAEDWVKQILAGRSSLHKAKIQQVINPTKILNGIKISKLKK